MISPQDPKIIEHYQKLPIPLKRALFAEETTDAVFDIGKEWQLTIEQIGELADEVGLVILGITRPESFGFEVGRKLNLTKERMDGIVGRVNEKIFLPIRNELRAIDKKETPSAPSPVFIKPLPASTPASTINKNTHASYAEKKDPYREPINGDEPAALSMHHGAPARTTPTTIPKQTKKSIDTTMPSGSPLVAEPLMELSGSATKTLKQPMPVSETVAPPQAPRVFTPLDAPSVTPSRPKPISWSDISPEKEKANSHSEATSALEQVLNAGSVVVAPQKTNQPKYSSKDPYREPLE